jgi:hypothetical protein
MPTLGAHPWHFVSVPLSVDFYVDVPGEPHWSRPERARLAEDPCDGSPTVITRGGALARRRLPVRLYVPAGATRAAELTIIRNAIQARGPYTLTTHLETLTVVFDPSGGQFDEVDESNATSINVGLAEVAPSVATPTLTAGVTTIGPSPNTIPVTWANWANPTGSDFVGLYLLTDPLSTDMGDARAVVLTGGLAAGSATITNYGGAAGIYQLRGVYGATPAIVLGPIISVTAGSPAAALTLTETSVAPSATLHIQWANWPSPTAGDFIGITRPWEAPNPSPSYYWATVLTGGGGSGSTTLVVPSFQDAGQYQLRGVYGAALNIIIGPTYTVT